MTTKIKNIFHAGSISPAFIAESLAAHQHKTNIGAHSIFLGQVRADVHNEQPVRAIRYTAYENMVNEKAHLIREETFAKYDLTCMHIHHSLGEVSTGEICLFVFVSSAHRAAATQACQELVERIKAELPIWGEELLGDGTQVWKENR